jgi:hypothetical protein
MNTGSEMLTAEKADGSRSALGTVMQPILYIMAAVGIYKGAKALINYFDVRAERKKIEKVGEAAMLNAESMERVANAQAMEMEAARIAASLPPEAMQETTMHRDRLGAAPKAANLGFGEMLKAQQAQTPSMEAAR